MGSGGILELKCCGHIVADTNVSPCTRARNICCRHKFCVRETKNVSDFVQKHFVSGQQMFPSLRSPRNIMGNNLSLFTRVLKKENCKLYQLARVSEAVLINGLFQKKYTPPWRMVNWKFSQEGGVAQTDRTVYERHVYLEPYIMNSTSTTTDFQITIN